MFTIFNAEQGSDLRALIRLVTVGFTAFGLKLHVDQIALIQAALETTLQLFVKSPLGSAPSTSLAEDPEGQPVGSSTPPATSSVPPVGTATPATLVASVPVDNGIGYVAPESGEL